MSASLAAPPPRTRPPRQRVIKAADLFCGAGGTSTGLAQVCAAMDARLHLTAVNHWDVAIQTHSANHPEAAHLCTSIDAVDPRRVVPDGHLDLLVASPECTHHSRARGGKPVSDQKRAGACHILHWVNALRVDNLLVENVREFLDWGPLSAKGKPIQRLRGQLFLQWVEMLRASNYTVDWRVLNAADYGDATTRERLFVIARRGRKRIHWPEPTHRRNAEQDLLAEAQPWRPAREIIDWSLPSESIFNRKRPLAGTTLARIEAGLRKFGGAAAEPFLVVLRGGGSKGAGGAVSVEKPVPTVTAGGNHIGVCEPFLLPHRTFENMTADSLDKPLRTVTAHSADFALVEPYILPLNHGAGDLRTHSIDDPMPTVTTVDAWALAQPFIVAPGGPNRQPRSVDDPMFTLTTRDHLSLVEPFLVSYYGTGNPASTDEPLETVTTKDRFALVLPNGTRARLDIRFRMLQPHELAAAMGFPRDYRFAGTREQTVKQIGNAVPVNLAAALCRSLLET